MPPGVVEMGSIVELRQEGGRTWRVQLRYPGQANIASSRIAISCPSGELSLALPKADRWMGYPQWADMSLNRDFCSYRIWNRADTSDYYAPK